MSNLVFTGTDKQYQHGYINCLKVVIGIMKDSRRKSKKDLLVLFKASLAFLEIMDKKEST